MSPAAKRKLTINTIDLLTALEGHGDGVKFYLNTQTGEVAPWIDPDISGEENPFDPEDDHIVEVPRTEASDDYQAMENFVERLDEDDVQGVLRRALAGKGAFRRFRETLAGYPDLRAQWEREKREHFLEEATTWLARLGIEPEYEPRSVPVPEPARNPDTPPLNVPPIGVVEMLLLGAPGGKTELLEGRVHRVFVAADRTQARKVFARLARELAEQNGLSWRKRFIDNTDRFSIERFELKMTDRIVELSIAVPKSVWDAFGANS
jgi:hypothetical protein